MKSIGFSDPDYEKWARFKKCSGLDHLEHGEVLVRAGRVLSLYEVLSPGLFREFTCIAKTLRIWEKRFTMFW